MSYLNKPIAYLIDSDIDAKGDLCNPQIPKDKPVLLMIQADFCGHCTKAKPAYQEFAEKNSGKVFVATIQADGDQKGEKELGQRIEKIDSSFQGFPHYMLYDRNRKRFTHNGGRDVASLQKFVNSHM